MTRKSHSYLDLTALPEIGALLMTPSPAWLWRIEDGQLLWTNAAGAAAVGVPTIADALEQRPENARPRDFETLAASAGDAPVLTALALAGADEAGRYFCAVSRIALGEDDNALLAVATDDNRAYNPLPVRAAQLAQSIAGEAMMVAILRPDGRPVALSPNFAALEGGREIAAALAERAEIEHPAKRVERFGNERRAAGAAFADTPEGKFVVVLIGPAIAEEEPRPAADPESSAVTPAETPRRFTFRIDGDQRVSEVSPELAAIVGPESSGIIGEGWSDAAARLGLDPDGEVARALSRRDTWSGVTVHWPVDGTDRRIAMSLTALPSFDGGRRFEGFRGFGVVKSEQQRAVEPAIAEAAPDSAEATPQPEPVQTQPEVEAAAQQSNVVKLPTAAERQGATPAERQEAPTHPARESSLSGDEQDAFRRIAEALRSVGPRRASATEPAATPPPPKPPAADRAAPARAQDEPAAVPARLLDRVPLGLLVYRDQELLFVNRTLLDRLGYPDTRSFEAAGGLEALFTGDAQDGHGTASRSIAMQAADGSRIDADARLHLVPWSDGPATMLSIRDAQTSVNERRTADHRTALARIDELEAVLDTATDGILLLDGEGRILNLNRSAEALFGVEASDVLGTPFTGLLAEESRKSANDYLEGLTSNGVASVLNDGREVIGKVPAGGLIPIFMTMGRLSEQGKFCAVLRDITHWKRAEEELVTARRTAEMASQQKSEFLAKISHEIRTPLNAIIGFSDVILEERFGPIGVERYREYLKDIRVSGTHLASLINDLLDLSRIESGKLDLTFNAVALNGIVQECVALMQPEANRRRIIIRTSLSAEVPQIVADERSLRQIILNLLSNAVKFNAPGGQAIVSTALDATGEVVLRVRDTGIGMSEKEIETALKPFQQIATTGPARFEGTGLGLPLTKALVEANRAQFAISSAPGEGTLVRIAFPVERVLQS